MIGFVEKGAHYESNSAKAMRAHLPNAVHGFQGLKRILHSMPYCSTLQLQASIGHLKQIGSSLEAKRAAIESNIAYASSYAEAERLRHRLFALERYEAERLSCLYALNEQLTAYETYNRNLDKAQYTIERIESRLLSRLNEIADFTKKAMQRAERIGEIPVKIRFK